MSWTVQVGTIWPGMVSLSWTVQVGTIWPGMTSLSWTVQVGTIWPGMVSLSWTVQVGTKPRFLMSGTLIFGNKTKQKLFYTLQTLHMLISQFAPTSVQISEHSDQYCGFSLSCQW